MKPNPDQRSRVTMMKRREVRVCNIQNILTLIPFVAVKSKEGIENHMGMNLVNLHHIMSFH